MEYRVKAIEGYEDRYEVDTDGNIWSLNYNNTGVRRKMGFVKRKGYTAVFLYDGTGTKNRKIFSTHRLVAKAFLPDYSEDLQVDHINCDKEDNKLENLRMVTGLQNCQRVKGKGWTLRAGKYYEASIKVKGKNIYLGRYKTQEEAELFYEQAKMFYHFQ